MASAICTIGRTTKEAEHWWTRLADAFVANFNNQWFDTLTARLGYAVAPAWLLYFQGGAAWGHTSTNVTFNGLQIGQTSKTRTGWTIGGGVEWMFAPQWSAFLEANYMDLGSRDGTLDPASGCVVCTFNAKATQTTVLVGLNYRFNWGKKAVLTRALPQLEPPRPRALLGVFLLKRDAVFGESGREGAFCFHENRFVADVCYWPEVVVSFSLCSH